MSDQPRIYLDNAAATAVDERVLQAMEPFWRDHIGNTGGLHTEGVTASRVVEKARESVAAVLGVHADEIIFTSGGTESNNLAILGFVQALAENHNDEKVHVVTTQAEHSSVRACFQHLERTGIEVTWLPVQESGRVDLEALEQALKPNTVLVSCMYVNNEVGTIEDLQGIHKTLARFSRKHAVPKPLLHTDACQAAPWLPLPVQSLGVDLLSIDSQKMYGPKGAGVLYRRRGASLQPLFCGGPQEFGLRPGTPPTSLVVGCARALKLVADELASFVPRVTELQEQFVTTVLDHVEGAQLNGPQVGARIAGNINISFPGIDAEQLVLELDAVGIAAGTRSACLKGNEPGSYVLEALYHDRKRALSAVRFSLSRNTTEDEMKRAAESVIDTVRGLDESKH